MEKSTKPVAIVTGGSKGIGRAISIEFSQCGYHVIVNYHSDDNAADELVSHIPVMRIQDISLPALLAPTERPSEVLPVIDPSERDLR